MSLQRPTRLATRYQELPVYPFHRLQQLCAHMRREGRELFDFSVGDPDLPTPEPIVARLQEAATNAQYHHYPPSQGFPFFRESVANLYQRRFGVTLDPDKEVTMLMGVKESVTHFAMTVVNPGEVVLIPDPGYPAYHSATMLCGAEPYFIPLREEEGFLLQPERVPREVLDRASLLYVNYPHNPTGAFSSTLELFEKIVATARRHNLVVMHDAPYIDIILEHDARAPSFLEVPGAREVGIECYSLSKTFNMTGWRLGAAVGNAELVGALRKLKAHLDSGQFGAVQEAGAYALDHIEELLPPRLETYRRRAGMMVDRLNKAGWNTELPRATFYLWTHFPSEESSEEFAARLVKESGWVVTPGSYLGKAGEGFVRIALTVGEQEMEQALSRLK